MDELKRIELLQRLFPEGRPIDDVDTGYLDKILLNQLGLCQPVPAKILREIEPDHLLMWATKNGIYQFVTTEMIDWLKNEIGNNLAIEIGAGKGVISRSLGIIGTDSYRQQEEDVKLVYALAGHATTDPPKEIKKYDALEAVRIYRPHTVVGAFITQWGTRAEQQQGIPCNSTGVHEIQMLAFVSKYICFGNLTTHANKRIFKLPHQEYKFDWLFSRGFDQSKNRVWVWGK